MKSRRIFLSAIALVTALLFPLAPQLASAAEIRVVTSGAFTEAYKILIPIYEQASGHKVVSAFGASIGNAPDSIPSRFARGDAELGFQQVSELIYFKELDMVGTLPPEVQQTIFFSAGLVEGAQEKDVALHLARFLASPAVAAIVRNTGLDPVTSDPAAKSR